MFANTSTPITALSHRMYNMQQVGVGKPYSMMRY
jgi:hypothetical protein